VSMGSKDNCKGKFLLEDHTPSNIYQIPYILCLASLNSMIGMANILYFLLIIVVLEKKAYICKMTVDCF